MHDIVPDNLVRVARELRGDAGLVWVEHLPALLARCAERWSLTLDGAFPSLSYSYAAPVRRADGRAAVLKVCYPDRAFRSEVAALQVYDGRGAVRVLALSQEDGAVLLERLVPGTPLTSVEDDRAATRVAITLMRELWRPAPPGSDFASVADWSVGLHRLRRRFGGASGPLSVHLLDRAEHLFSELIASQTAPVVLHGDLHHGNILSAAPDRWLAIDPKGVVGEPAYEVGAFLRNPLPDLLTTANPRATLARRLDQFAAELSLDRARLRDWGLAQAVLAACWVIEDHGHGWEPAMAVAEVLANLR